jgi:CBS domain containing-hemolysin-like protein
MRNTFCCGWRFILTPSWREAPVEGRTTSPPRFPETGMAEPGAHDRRLSGLRHWLRHLRRGDVGEGDVHQELEELIEEHQQEAPIDPHEHRLLSNILKLHELSATEIMVPRADIVALAEDTPFEQATKQMVEHGHSRVPVYRDTLDDVVGMLHVKDMMPYAVDHKTVPLGRIVRKVLFVAPSLPVLDLLLQMRLSRVHMAVVVDEFGGIDGLVTIEDVIEQIVGEIEDEHDDADRPKIIARPDGTIIADARTPLASLEGRVIPPALLQELEEDVTTLGGLVTNLAGKVPSRGEIVRHSSGIEFEVLDADPRRVKRLRVRAPMPAERQSSKTSDKITGK